MSELTLLVKVGVYAAMAISIIAAIAVVTLPHIFHAAISLVLVLIGIAGLYLALQAEFLAMVQILLYVGAIMTLVIFAIMLTQRLSDKSIQQSNGLGLPTAIGGVTFLAVLIRLIYATPWAVNEPQTTTYVTTADLGVALMTTYVFPFEVISVVLIAVLVGAIVIAKKDKLS